jgi:hypothetical protein
MIVPVDQPKHQLGRPLPDLHPATPDAPDLRDLAIPVRRMLDQVVAASQSSIDRLELFGDVGAGALELVVRGLGVRA